jgi:Fe-S-cluster containining protein
VIVPLSRAYSTRYGAPTVDRVDTDIFVRTYFHDCMGCGFCGDSCCQYGCDVDAVSETALLTNAPALEEVVGVPAGEWFTGRREIDAEFPGGNFTRSQVRDGRCVFLNRAGRGCLIHKHCLEKGVDFHELKPMVCCLFPLTFDAGLLQVSRELADESLICTGAGLTAYRSARNDALYYFGAELVAELDALEAEAFPNRRASIALDVIDG